jgi:addiction module HigA family antidote
MSKFPPLHPGEYLREEFMIPLGLSSRRLAEALEIPPNRISAIVAGKRSITADTALRLERALKMPARFWLGLQQRYDLEIARDTLGPLDHIKPLAA